eukprot:TRINITY_DN60711_c0_g1_i1.p1 TRINITY_DN60711_c0_g1~~TRINITY_DN60711_c0_g1_i1.p1  ORF type:complete len:300 (+),score=59.63 TRINITY_DN60711_c0_g1_i1:26-901(+)
MAAPLEAALMALFTLATLAGSAAGKDAKVSVPRTEMTHSCSRMVSRHVRKALEKEILKPAEKAGIKSWPPGCPLDPARDLYGMQEKNKSRKRGSTTMWTCGYCQKVFKNEHYLDLHIERKHMAEAPVSGVCLADYCEIFDVCHGELKHRRVNRQKSDGALQAPSCSNETMLKERARCEESLKKCLPLDQEASRQLHAKLSRHFCQVMDCRIRAEQHREQSSEMMPVVVLLILVVLLGFVIFSITVCCVDYSDDLLVWLEESKIISSGTRTQVQKARETTRQQLNLDRTKMI